MRPAQPDRPRTPHASSQPWPCRCASCGCAARLLQVRSWNARLGRRGCVADGPGGDGAHAGHAHALVARRRAGRQHACDSTRTQTRRALLLARQAAGAQGATRGLPRHMSSSPFAVLPLAMLSALVSCHAARLEQRNPMLRLARMWHRQRAGFQKYTAAAGAPEKKSSASPKSRCSSGCVLPRASSTTRSVSLRRGALQSGAVPRRARSSCRPGEVWLCWGTSALAPALRPTVEAVADWAAYT
jgi:hypothetical protein